MGHEKNFTPGEGIRRLLTVHVQEDIERDTVEVNKHMERSPSLDTYRVGPSLQPTYLFYRRSRLIVVVPSHHTKTTNCLSLVILVCDQTYV